MAYDSSREALLAATHRLIAMTALSPWETVVSVVAEPSRLHDLLGL